MLSRNHKVRYNELITGDDLCRAARSKVVNYIVCDVGTETGLSKKHFGIMRQHPSFASNSKTVT